MRDHRRLERLYGKMTARETATLVFSHLSRGNTAEADRIRDLVPLKVYRLPDPEHTDHFERLRRVTLLYGMDRWCYEAHCFAATGFLVHYYYSQRSEDDERAQACLDGWQLWETRLLSLDAALEAACRNHGVDAADVRRMAGLDSPYEVLGLGQVDPHLLAEMTCAFDDVLAAE